jgi:NAD(P)H-quinone oxidoreductase subunit 5
MVSVHELLGSTRFSVLEAASTLPMWEVSVIAALFLIAAMGKSAMLPFSGWLPRAMEGPTPSSALFYGALSIHMGLFLLLRIWPLFEVSHFVRGAAVVIGLATAVYGAAVARTHTDAKGTLAHATLSQVGIILAEIALGFTTIAMIHIACHAMLRLFQYLRAPNAIHDAHRLGHAVAVHPHPPERREPSRWERLTYVHALHRLRIEDMLDAAVAPVVALARGLDVLDARFRRAASIDRSS